MKIKINYSLPNLESLLFEKLKMEYDETNTLRMIVDVRTDVNLLYFAKTSVRNVLLYKFEINEVDVIDIISIKLLSDCEPFIKN